MPVMLFDGCEYTVEEKRACRADLRADLHSGAIDEAEYVYLCEQYGIPASGRIENGS